MVRNSSGLDPCFRFASIVNSDTSEDIVANLLASSKR
jgi:hypothetical protein